MSKNWFDYIDSHGLVTQRQPNGDGGDSIQKTCLYYLGKLLSDPKQDAFKYMADFNNALVQYERLPGWFVRYPYTEAYDQLSDFSRDQQTTLVIAMAIYGMATRPNRLYKTHAGRKFVYQNKDLPVPQLFAQYSRSWGSKKKWWYFLSDIGLLVNSLLICFWQTRKPSFIGRFLGSLKWLPGHWFFIAMNPPNAEGVQGSLRGPDFTSDDINHTVALVQAKMHGPSFVSNLAHFIYKKFRPKGVQYAWDSYFAPNDAPPMNELWYSIIERYF